MENKNRNKRKTELGKKPALRKTGRRRGNLFAKIFLYMVIEMGVMMGVPVRPEEIEQLTRSMQGTVASVEEEQEQDGE